MPGSSGSTSLTVAGRDGSSFTSSGFTVFAGESAVGAVRAVARTSTVSCRAGGVSVVCGAANAGMSSSHAAVHLSLGMSVTLLGTAPATRTEPESLENKGPATIT
jgi:hypothetical protein